MFRFNINLLAITLLTGLISATAFGQRSFFEDITLTGGGNGAADLTFRADGSAANDFRFLARTNGTSLDLDGPVQNQAMRIFRDTKTNTLVTNQFGVGIGTANPIEPLHIYSDTNSSLPRAKVLIEDRNPILAVRNQLTLKNNGGSRISLTNSDSGERWVVTTDNADTLSLKMLGSGKPSFRIRESGQLSMLVGTNNILTLQNNGNLIIAGNLIESSDRNKKHRFQPIDRREILDKVVQLPLSSWSFKHDEAGIRHIGPMAQDFRAAFGLGADDKTIATIDAAGVSLAAVQGLHDMVMEKDQQIRELEKQFEENAEEFNQRLEELEALAESLKLRL